MRGHVSARRKVVRKRERGREPWSDEKKYSRREREVKDQEGRSIKCKVARHATHKGHDPNQKINTAQTNSHKHNHRSETIR